MSEDELVMTAAEYSGQVEQWLQQAYQWQILAVGFPSYLAYQASLQGRTQQQQAQGVLPSNPQNVYQQQQQQPPVPEEFKEFVVPPMWKRIFAEILDFLLLFSLKLSLTFVAVDTLGLFDLDAFMAKYDSSLVALASGEELDLERAMEMTSEILVLELAHRMVVCVFEAVCTGTGAMGEHGGATSGKYVMGLRIYKCSEIALTGHPNRVKIKPGTNLGILLATLRALVKSLSMAFLFPVCLLFMFLPFNRTIYDVISQSIVVEVSPPRPENRQRRRN